MKPVRLLRLAFLLVLASGVPMTCLAQDSNNNTITNRDVVKMVKAGIPESIILRVIQTSATSFVTTAPALIDLKKQGASERILGAVLDSRFGPSGFAPPTQPFTSGGMGPIGASGPHRLPAVEANLRLNGTTNGKFSMKNNQIKVEKSGVPLFSLKWYEKPASK